jgi:hypothetical protein
LVQGRCLAAETDACFWRSLLVPVDGMSPAFRPIHTIPFYRFDRIRYTFATSALERRSLAVAFSIVYSSWVAMLAVSHQAP